MNDGGPAFPTPESHGDDFEGMSLRDYFAAKAIAGILSNPNITWSDMQTERVLASHAWKIADAMLAEKAKS
jgi:hypothetical protein